MSARSWLINIDDPAADGLLADRTTGLSLAQQQFFRNGTEIVTLYPLRQSGLPSPLFVGLDLSRLDTVRVGVGRKDQAPTSGTFPLTVNGDGTGLTVLSYAITAADLQTALNANPGVTGASTTVAVVKLGGLYVVTVQTSNVALTFASPENALTPPSVVSISNSTAASAGVRAVYEIRLLQQPYAYTADFAIEDPNALAGVIASVDTATNTITTVAPHGLSIDDRTRFGTTGALPAGLVVGQDCYVLTAGFGASTFRVSRWPEGSEIDITGSGSGTNSVYHRDNGVTLTISDPGSSTTPGVYIVTISPNPLTGAFRFLWQQRQTALVTVGANTAIAASWSVLSIEPNVWTTTYIDLPDTSNNIVRMWVNVNSGGTPPATPPGGSLLEIDTGAAPTREQVFAAAVDGLNGTGEFTAFIFGSTLRVTSAAGGERVDLSSNNAGLTLTTGNPGSSGQLVGKAFVLNDGLATTVGVYVTGGTQTDVPALALTCSRQLAINLPGNESASAAATLVAAGLAADPSFTNSTASGPIVTAINTLAGARGTNTGVSAGYFSTAITQSGFSVVATLDNGADATTFQNALGDAFSVTKSADFYWTVTHTALGLITAPTCEDAGLTFPVGIDITLDFSTLAAQEYFYNNPTLDTLPAYLEIKAANTGEAEVIWLQTTVDLTRDLLDAATTGGPNFSIPDSPSFKSGVAVVTIGSQTVTVTFSSPFASVPTKPFPGAVIKTNTGDADPPFVMASQSITASGFVIKLSDDPTASATIPWMMLL